MSERPKIAQRKPPADVIARARRLANDMARHIIGENDPTGAEEACARCVDLAIAALSDAAAQVDEARRVAINMLRNPSSDMLNRAADDIRRNIDPLQQRAKYLLDAVADDIERALSPKQNTQGEG